MAMKKDFHALRHERFTRGRLRKEILTLEEGLWLIIGLLFGWLAGAVWGPFVLFIPLIIFVVWIYEEFYARKYGLFTIHGKKIKK